MSALNVYIQWRSALCGGSEPYYFPNKFSRDFREKYSVPAVYRWRVMGIEGEAKEKIYIGEAEDLVRRIQRVRTPSRKAKEADTNKRLNKVFGEYLAEGRKIVLDIADFEPFDARIAEGGSGSERVIRFDQHALRDRFRRRALENLLLVFAQESEKYDVLNIRVDPYDKIVEAFGKLPPRVQRELLKKQLGEKS